jgi:hypothetical protein
MLPLEKALFAAPQKDKSSSSDRNFHILARHYGFDGKGGANFQRTGNEFGLTRERVRQIASDADPRLHLLPKGVTALDRVNAAIASSMPGPANAIESKLQQSGFTVKPFRIEGILNAASLLCRPVTFRISTLSKTRYVVPASYPQFRDIVGQVRQQVRKHGMATVADFLSDQTGKEDTQREVALLEAVLGSQKDFRWLDRRSGWFWLADTPRNCAASRVRKMLAVANPLPINEIRAGLARMGAPVAPERTLLEFCRQIPGLTVHGDMVHANPGIRAAEVLNKTERDIFQLLSENNGCMSNSDLICQSNVLGMKRPTFYQCVTYSPIVTRHNRSHYRLIGSPGQEVTGSESGAASA